MAKWAKGCSKEDVTNVYSAIISTKPEDLANSLFYMGNTCPKCESEFIATRKAVAKSRIESVMKVIKRLQPNFDSSAEAPIKPWDTSEMKSLKGKSWPNVLGRRILIPKSASKEQKAYFISNLLTAMAHIS